MAETEEAEIRFAAAVAAKDEAAAALAKARDDAELIRMESSAIQDEARLILDAAKEKAGELADAEETAFGLVEQAHHEAAAIRAKVEGDVAASEAKLEVLTSEIESIGQSSSDETASEIELVKRDAEEAARAADERIAFLVGQLEEAEARNAEVALAELANTNEESSADADAVTPRDASSADSSDETMPGGYSPGGGLAGASMPQPADVARARTYDYDSDSLDAIRDEAARALEETRSIREAPATVDSAEPDRSEGTVPPETVKFDYAPSVEPPNRKKSIDSDDDERSTKPVESRYSRNSAKLPRLGLGPEAASSAIANLRKQMTADN